MASPDSLLLLAAVVAAYYLTRPVEPEPNLALRPGYSQLGTTPDWNDLNVYQSTITAASLEQLLSDVYSEGDAWKSVVEIRDGEALLKTEDDSQPITLKLAEKDGTPVGSRYWRKPSELPPLENLEKPLSGLKVAIDPGHIGGQWAKMEERWYQINQEGTTVMEGELTLKTSQHLATRLRALGAQVTLTRESTEPATDYRPADFEPLAKAYLRSRGIDPDDPASAPKMKGYMTVRKQSERLFYRAQEIRSRAWRINTITQPDLVVCVHFNAEAWGNPAKPDFIPRNHLHLLINGTYSLGELRLHDQRHQMFHRLFQRTHDEERALSEQVADSLAEVTGLPAYVYGTPNAKLVGENTYVYARNLLANRVYTCPVVFLEPYVMNNREVYDRISAGDYEGKREIAGTEKESIFREYARGVADGLATYYRNRRAPQP